MPKPIGAERRKNQRVDADIVVSYHIKAEANNYDLSQTKNVSKGGMLLTTNRRFEKGTLLEMTILLPLLEEKIQVLAEVVDSEEVVKDLIYQTRLSFHALRAQLQDSLGLFVQRLSESHE